MARSLLAIALSALVGIAGANAQSYPSRPVTIIVPYPAGGPTDQVARQLAPKMAAKFGQNFVDRERQRRRHQHRRPARRALGARRPHAVHPQPADLGQRLALQVAAVRHREGLPADRHDQLQPAGAGRAQVARRQHAARAGRLDEDHAGADGRIPASAAPAISPPFLLAQALGVKVDSHPLSRRGPDAAGHARRPHRPVLRDAAAGGRAVRLRRGQGVRHHLEGAPRRSSPACRASSRPMARSSRSCSGRSCSRRPARRSRSSMRSTAALQEALPTRRS